MSTECEFLKALKKLREHELRRCSGAALFVGHGLVGCALPGNHRGRCSASVDGKLYEWSEEYEPEEVKEQ